MILTHPLVSASTIQESPEQCFQHPLNSNAVRYTKSIGDWVGLERLGIHLVRVEPGRDTTQFHYHHQEEEFIYILSGRGIAAIGEAEDEVGPGDFMGFTAPSQPHSLSNPFDQDLVYLMGGERRSVDICDYPKLQQRLIRNGEDRQLYNWDDRQQFET
ncbi:cupin domain-containing protein [Acaryochloris sp. IP29b_bin.137]|uniref:cupin domain-containing protein n=1 Tax=Acaryochloris sp. IP29b_bin.137 TaxID=2969217 RepID=UPI00260BB227|nr:cupin domain-containing protein [Acaryochloris sp. IP29b_bin.137]